MRSPRSSAPVMIVAAVLCALAANTTLAQQERFEAGVSIGYASLSLSDTAGRLDGADGFRFEPRLIVKPLDGRPEFRLAFAAGLSFYREDFDAPEPDPIFGSAEGAYEEITLVVPELQVSWRQPIGERWSLEGGVGVGGTFADYAAANVIEDNFISSTGSDSASGFSVHPFIRGGYQTDGWTFGVEAGYLWSDVDFGDPVGGGLKEWSVGVFLHFAK